MERIIEYKQKSLIEEKRKQAMDQHLNFIVDQTEKYSSWLIESLASQNSVSSSSLADTASATAANEDEYELESETPDDESTIEREEQLDNHNNDDSTNDELKQLQMESEIPIEDLLRDYNLDENYFNLASNENSSELNSLLVKPQQTAAASMEVDDDEAEVEEEEDDDDDQEDADEDEDDSVSLFLCHLTNSALI